MKKILNRIKGIDTLTLVLSLTLLLSAIIILPKQLCSLYNLPKVFVLFIGGICILFYILRNNHKIKMDTVDIILYIYIIIVAVSFIFSVSSKASIMGASNRYEGVITVFIYMLIYFASKHLFKVYPKFLDIILITASVICIIAIMQLYNIVPIHKFLNIPYNSASGTFGNRNFMGSFVSIVLPLSIYLYIFKKKSYIYSAEIAFIAMLATMTRSAQVAFITVSIISIIYIIKLKNKEITKRFIKLFLIYIVIFLAMDISLKGELFFRSISTFQDANKVINKVVDTKNTENTEIESVGSGRVAIYKLTSRLIPKKFILGVGVDALNEGLLLYEKDEYLKFQNKYKVYIDKAHSEPLQIIVTEGIFAFLLYSSAILLIIKYNILRVKENKAYFCFTIIIISYLIQGLFNISTIGVAPIFFFVLGLSQNEYFKLNNN